MIKYTISVKYAKDKNFQTQPMHLDMLIELLEKTQPTIISKGHDSFMLRPDTASIDRWFSFLSIVFNTMEGCQDASEAFKTDLVKQINALKALKSAIEGK